MTPRELRRTIEAFEAALSDLREHLAEVEKPSAPDDILTIGDAARAMKISIRAVRELCLSGQIAHERIGARGGRYRIRRSDLDTYLRQRRRPALPSRVGAAAV